MTKPKYISVFCVFKFLGISGSVWQTYSKYYILKYIIYQNIIFFISVMCISHFSCGAVVDWFESMLAYLGNKQVIPASLQTFYGGLVLDNFLSLYMYTDRTVTNYKPVCVPMLPMLCGMPIIKYTIERQMLHKFLATLHQLTIN